MTKLKFIALFIPALLFFFYSCKNDPEDQPQDQQSDEFIADNTTFKNFKTWETAASYQGADPSLAGAHGSTDSTVVRTVYFKNGQDPVDGVYPTGTVIVKESVNPDTTIHTLSAMAKRGNNFNPSGNDWEWFVLIPDGSIATDNGGNQIRGANLMGGLCITCHHQAVDKDYVFSK